MSDQMETRFPNHRIYKPNKEGKGAASQFELKLRSGQYRDDAIAFWVAAQQDGVGEDDNAKFHWENPNHRVQMKLGLVDIAEILTVLRGQKEFVGMAKDKGLYHQNEKGSTSLQFAWHYTEGRPPVYYIRLAAKPKDGQLVEVRHSLTQAEAVVLEIILTNAVGYFTGWR